MSIILLITFILIGKAIDTYIKNKREEELKTILINGQLYIYNIINKINLVQTVDVSDLRYSDMETVNFQYHTIKYYLEKQSSFATGCHIKDFYISQLKKEFYKIESLRTNDNKGKSWTINELNLYTKLIGIPEIAQ